jgi:hypothetical protein
MRTTIDPLRNERLDAEQAEEREESAARWQMGLLLVLVALVAFLASFLLLHAGVHDMWLRYPLSLVPAYLAFFLLVARWLRLNRHLASRAAVERGSSSEGGSPLELIELLEFTPESAAGVLLLVVLGLIGGAAYVIVIAPSLLAELVVAAAISGALYGPLRESPVSHVRSATPAHEPWFAILFRRTVVPVGLSMIGLLIIGICFQRYAPEARSISGVVRHLSEDGSGRR